MMTVIKLEYLAVYGRASTMGVPVGELQSTGLETRVESRSANHRPSIKLLKIDRCHRLDCDWTAIGPPTHFYRARLC